MTKATNPIDDILENLVEDFINFDSETRDLFNQDKAKAIQDLYAAILKCVPDKAENIKTMAGGKSTYWYAHNKTVDEVTKNLAALFDIGGGGNDT